MPPSRSFPDLWVTGGFGGHCIDAQDNVLLLNRQDVLDGELNSGHLGPLMIELDPTGKVVHSWGDPNLIEGTVAGLRNGPIQFRLHTCHFDPDNRSPDLKDFAPTPIRRLNAVQYPGIVSRWR